MFNLVQMRKQADSLKVELLELTVATKQPEFQNQDRRMQVLTAEQIGKMSDHHWFLTQRIKMMEQ